MGSRGTCSVLPMDQSARLLLYYYCSQPTRDISCISCMKKKVDWSASASLFLPFNSKFGRESWVHSYSYMTHRRPCEIPDTLPNHHPEYPIHYSIGILCAQTRIARMDGARDSSFLVFRNAWNGSLQLLPANLGTCTTSLLCISHGL